MILYPNGLSEKKYKCPICKKTEISIPYMICEKCTVHEKTQKCRLCLKSANSVGMPKADLDKDLLCFRCASVARCFNCGKTTQIGQLSCSACNAELDDEYDRAG